MSQGGIVFGMPAIDVEIKGWKKWGDGKFLVRCVFIFRLLRGSLCYLVIFLLVDVGGVGSQVDVTIPLASASKYQISNQITQTISQVYKCF